MNYNCKENTVWIFMGEEASHPSGVFSTLDLARKWIAANKVSGILTEYNIDTGVYDWAIKQGHFSPKHAYQETPKFIEKFSSAYAKHFHFENGNED